MNLVHKNIHRHIFSIGEQPKSWRGTPVSTRYLRYVRGKQCPYPLRKALMAIGTGRSVAETGFVPCRYDGENNLRPTAQAKPADTVARFY